MKVINEQNWPEFPRYDAPPEDRRLRLGDQIFIFDSTGSIFSYGVALEMLFLGGELNVIVTIAPNFVKKHKGMPPLVRLLVKEVAWHSPGQWHWHQSNEEPPMYGEIKWRIK